MAIKVSVKSGECPLDEYGLGEISTQIERSVKRLLYQCLDQIEIGIYPENTRKDDIDITLRLAWETEMDSCEGRYFSVRAIIQSELDEDADFARRMAEESPEDGISEEKELDAKRDAIATQLENIARLLRDKRRLT